MGKNAGSIDRLIVSLGPKVRRRKLETSQDTIQKEKRESQVVALL